MNLIQDQNPGGHKVDRASFPNQIQYKVSKMHSPNPTLEKRGMTNRGRGRQGRRKRTGTSGLGARQGEREKREWVRDI